MKKLSNNCTLFVYNQKSYVSGLLGAVIFISFSVIAFMNQVYILLIVFLSFAIILTYKSSVKYLKICAVFFEIYEKNILKKIIEKKKFELKTIKKIIIKYYTWDWLSFMYSVRFYNDAEIMIFFNDGRIVNLQHNDISMKTLKEFKKIIEKTQKDIEVIIK